MALESSDDDGDGLEDLRGLFEEPPLASSSDPTFVFELSGGRGKAVIQQDPSSRRDGLDGAVGTEARSATGAKIWDTSVSCASWFAC